MVDVVPDLTDALEDDNTRALAGYMYIKELFTNDNDYDLGSIKGRLNLYFFLVRHHYGVEAIKDLLVLAGTPQHTSCKLRNQTLHNPCHWIHYTSKSQTQLVTHCSPPNPATPLDCTCKTQME